MVSTWPNSSLLTVEDFLQIRFPSDYKVELDNGVIRIIAGGTARRARVVGNILAFLATALRGSGFSTLSSMGVRTHARSLRYPSIAVFYGRTGSENDDLQFFDNPEVVIEVLSPPTRDENFRVKLPEYRAMPSVETILFVEPDSGALRMLERTGASAWVDAELDVGADVPLPSLRLTLPNTEIFARN